MADRPTIRTAGAGAKYSTELLNTNFQALRDAFDNLVGTAGTGGSNNTMTAALDMGGFDLRNIGAATTTDGTSLGDIVTLAAEWANKAEDSLVSAAAGGDEVNDYSALHHANKASASASAAATSETNAATSETNAANSAAQAEAAAQGWAAVTTLTTGTTNIETTDARTYYIIDASGGTVTINLPAIGTEDGILFGFEVADASNTITIVRDGTDTINGAASNYTSLTTIGDIVHFIGDDGTPDNWLATLISRVNVDDVTIQQSGRTLSVKDGGITVAKLANAAKPYDIGFTAGYAADGTETDAAVQEYGHIVLTRAITFEDIQAYAETAPTGANMIFDIKKNGSTIFSTLPEIDAGANADDTNHVLSVTTAVAGDRLSFEVTQVGSTVAGSGVMFTLQARLT